MEDWFKWDVPELEGRMIHVSRKYTVCEVLRQIYKKTDDPEIKMLARIGSTMAKSMAARLTTHEGHGWGQRIYPPNPFFKE